ncbi:MAG: hypothetical protein DMF98_28325 [Acidobacteria bacterium]|nr:MAG: hypothetical protein DMF98_28325 [Acidobacteriota bacterium]
MASLCAATIRSCKSRWLRTHCHFSLERPGPYTDMFFPLRKSASGSEFAITASLTPEPVSQEYVARGS